MQGHKIFSYIQFDVIEFDLMLVLYGTETFFPTTSRESRIWNSLPAPIFPDYNPSAFKSQVYHCLYKGQVPSVFL